MSNTLRQQQERQSRSVRGLSRTMSNKSMDTAAKKTLYFTSSTSITMPLIDGSSVAYTGLYKCTLNENHEENDSIDGDDQQQCRETEKVADGRNRDGKPHAALPLHNLQFHNGNRETKNRNKKTSHSASTKTYGICAEAG